MNYNILETILFILAAVLVTTIIFRRFQLPVILGYFVVGGLMGPHALGLIPDLVAIKQLAEFGVVFLMFTVGLEFSISKLLSLKYSVFFIGGLQVILSVAITTLFGIELGMTLQSALVVGGIVAMSSTAIVVKQLNEQHELHTPHGLTAVGILLFQDLAVIPFIILIVGLSNNNDVPLSSIFLFAMLKGIFAIILITLLGRWLLRPLFHLIAKTRIIELFTLTVFLITLASAWLTNIFGLSYALGAFLAGIMLGETEFRHQIEMEIRPFRDILLGLFFITIGMLADVAKWQELWVWITLLSTAIFIGKTLLIVIITRLSGKNASESLRTGLVLAQGGEFGFAILTLALSQQLLSPDYAQVILAALILSIAISPILILFNKNIANFILPHSKKMNPSLVEQKIEEYANKLDRHIIICGYGRVGQHLAKVLDKINFPHIGLDINSTLIKQANSSGEHVMFGDACNPGILQAAGLNRAKALVISFDNIKSSIKTLSVVRQTHPSLPILARCKDQIEFAELKNLGATKVVAEIFEESLTLSQNLLDLIHYPKNKTEHLIHHVRNKDYELLRKIIPNSFDENEMYEFSLHENLVPIILNENAYAINHKLGEFDFAEIDVQVIAIRRGKSTSLKPNQDVKLLQNDILILFGTPINIEQAEFLLLQHSNQI